MCRLLGNGPCPVWNRSPGWNNSPMRRPSQPRPPTQSPPQTSCPRRRLACDAPPTVSDLTDQSVWVIDANSLIFQVFHAIPEMTSPQGEPVNAVFGFTARHDVPAGKEAAGLSVLCDRSARGRRSGTSCLTDTRRSAASAGRACVPQSRKIRQVLERMGIPAVRVAGFEADDSAGHRRPADRRAGRRLLRGHAATRIAGS